MSLLGSSDLHDLIDAGIVKAPHSAVQAASIDITFGSEFLLEQKPRFFQRKFVTINGKMPPNFSTHQHKAMLPRKGFALAVAAERVDLPDWLKCGYVLNSTAARSGMDHALAVWVDPGFCGNITLEVVNNLSYHKMFLQEGERAGQLFFESVEPGESYAGRYQGDRGVQMPKVRV